MIKAFIRKILPGKLRKEIYLLRKNGWKDYLALLKARREYTKFNPDPSSNIYHTRRGVSIRYYPGFRKHLEPRFLDSFDQIEEYHAFINLCEDKDSLIDVGAGRGLFSLGFCSLTGGTAYAFEPSPYMREGLWKNVQLNPEYDVHVVPVALGAGSGEVDMGRNREGQLAFHKDKQATQGLTVQTESLDNYIRENDIAPDCIKIDVEGYELEVLKGALNCLRQHKPLVFLEVHIEFLAKMETPLKDVFNCLLEKGYTVYHTNLTRVEDPVRYCNEARARRGQIVAHFVCNASPLRAL